MKQVSLKKGVVNSAFHAQTPRAPPYWKSAKNFVGVKADKRMGEGLALSWAEDMGIKKKDLRETYQMLIEAETEEADCFLHLVSHQCFPYVRVLIETCANWKIHAHCKAHSDIGLRAILACWSINNGCRTWIKIK